MHRVYGLMEPKELSLFDDSGAPTPEAAIPHFDVETYEAEFDYGRLAPQMGLVATLMADGRWRTLEEVAQATGCPQASVSARLRDLRKEKFGGFTVNRRARGDRAQGRFEYQVLRDDA